MAQPSAESYARYLEIANGIDARLRQISQDTVIHSSHGPTLNHPLFKELVGMGEMIVPYIIHHMVRTGATWCHLLMLHEIVGHTPGLPDNAGRFYLQISDWLRWFEESRGRFKDDIYHGLV